MASAALHGFVLGFAIALTPGPMFFLCLRRTLGSGWRSGLATGLGIATADGIYAAIAAGGIGTIALLITGAERWLTLAGGIALLLLGAKTFSAAVAVAPPPASPAPPRRAGRSLEPLPPHAYTSALALTLANPATIVSFGAIFAAVGLRSAVTVAATAAGSLTWWVLLVAAATRLRSALGERAGLLRGFAGLALVAFGVVAVASALLR